MAPTLNMLLPFSLAPLVAGDALRGARSPMQSYSPVCSDMARANGDRWHSAYGEKYDCEWYGEGRYGKRCRKYGSYSKYGWLCANDACCVCGGGMPAVVPTPAPAQCADMTLANGDRWHSAFGEKYACEWYEEGRAGKRCRKYGSYSKYGWLSANEACCACGGGMPAVVPAPAPSQCADRTLANGDRWHSAYGEKYDCGWYGEGRAGKRCREYGSYTKYGALSANEACCACGGGMPAVVPTPAPAQCWDRTLANGDRWHSAYGEKYDCEWYGEGRDGKRCREYGSYTKYGALSANEACCVCGGGMHATPAPTNQCFETSFGALDRYRHTCADYARNPEWCTNPRAERKRDDEDFSHDLMCCACGGGTTDPGVCVDKTLENGMPWHRAYGEKYTCEWFGEGRAGKRCREYGAYTKHGALSANEACCVCGGGMPAGATTITYTTTVTLTSTTATSTTEATPAPTEATPAPTEAPTEAPTPAPTEEPTEAPTPAATEEAPTPAPPEAA